MLWYAAPRCASLYQYTKFIHRKLSFKKEHRRMRWKILSIASLVATVVGAGSTLAIVYGIFHTPRRLVSFDLFVIGTLLIPLASIIVASIFVYRHTARRRKLQALITALISSFLILTIFIASALFFQSRTPAPTVPATLKGVG